MIGDYDLIFKAIVDKDQLTTLYHGHRRELCPHALGRTGGRLSVFCWQFAGTSRQGLPSGGAWRCFHLDEMSGVSVRKGPWHTGPLDGHTRPQSCVEHVEVEVRR